MIALFACYSCRSTKLIYRYPELSRYNYDTLNLLVEQDSLRTLSDSYLRREKFGNWEIYLSGEPRQLGASMGRLSQDLYQRQERIFINKLLEDIPSVRKRKWIMRFVRWYNRNLEQYIPDPYLLEIYALSNYLNDDFDYLGTAYQRTLWMHAAHDIGHALQDLAIVGCSSLAVWGDQTADGKLLIGRNLDFYMNDAFAEQKMIYFVRPADGIPYMSVAWPGMIGVLSGMNLEGLTVTLNAGKSSVPLSAKTPISLVARTVLQHASTIEEAIAIVRKQKVFVSESLMIGSAKDKRAIILELSPRKMEIVEPSSNRLLCTNHFQGSGFEQDRRNKKHIMGSHSLYRYQKLEELLDGKNKVTPADVAGMLRDKSGKNGISIGFGNDKSLNHLLAHHGIIFQPEDRRVYVSNNPGQMGAFIAYDLRTVFSKSWQDHPSFGIDSLRIEADDFIHSRNYQDFYLFKQSTARYLSMLNTEIVQISSSELSEYIALNPDLWLGYYISGRILYLKQDYKKAQFYFEEALKREIPTVKIQKEIQDYVKKSTVQWKKMQ